jgi:hypothetical protein
LDILDGRIVRGVGAASTTVAAQLPIFERQYDELRGAHPATINVDVGSPIDLRIDFRTLRYGSDCFEFIRVMLEYPLGAPTHRALIYQPYGFHWGVRKLTSHLEVLVCTKLDDVEVGTPCRIHVPKSERRSSSTSVHYLRAKLIGATIPTDELRAKWAYGELTSTRFARYYEPGTPRGLLEKAKRKTPFEFLDQNDIRTLVGLHAGVRAGLLPFLRGINEFRCEAWTREQLLQLLTLRDFDWQGLNRTFSLRDLLALARFPASLISTAEAIEVDWQLLNLEPAVIGNLEDRQILIDGYLRCLLFLRSGEQGEYLVWVPQRD